jgi:EpsI family protein
MGDMSVPPNSSWPRFAVAAALLAVAAIFLHLRSRAETIPAHRDLAAFPMQLGDWRGRDVPLPPSFLAVLGPGDFLTRLYSSGDNRVPPVDLYIAYFPSQKTGDTIHSPKNCLPGAGWTPLVSSRLSLPRPDGSSFPVNRYLLAKGDERMLVLYWYQAHGRAVASEYAAKLFLVADAMRVNRTDGGLVRVLTPVAVGVESEEAAERRVVGFAKLLIPFLNDYIPR